MGGSPANGVRWAVGRRRPSGSWPGKGRSGGFWPAAGILRPVTPYRFVTELRVTASAEAVYGAIADPRWVDAWGDATRVERRHAGDASGLGACFDATVRAPLGYRLSATIETVQTEPCRLLRMRATGSVEGTGLWELEDRGAATEVRFTWDVHTTERWMDVLAPVARPVFERSHGIVMRNAARTAARYLEADLVHFDSRPLPL